MLHEYTYKQQSNLAEYCRTGELKDIDGANTKNLPHYRRLVFNVIEGTLSKAYPLTHNLLDEDEWAGLINNFFSTYKIPDPQVWKMPKSLYEYFSASLNKLKEKYPFLEELLLFEWLEIEVHMMEDIDSNFGSRNGDFLEDTIVLNKEHRIISLEYPVHKIKAKDITLEMKGNYFVLIYREKETGKVKFMELSPVFGYVIKKISDNQKLNKIISDISNLYNIEDKILIYNKIKPFLEDLKERNIVLGFNKRI